MAKSRLSYIIGIILFGSLFIADLFIEDPFVFSDEFVLGLITFAFLMLLLFTFDSFSNFVRMLRKSLGRYNKVIEGIFLIMIIYGIFNLYTFSVENTTLQNVIDANTPSPFDGLSQLELDRLQNEIDTFKLLPYPDKKDYINNYYFDNCLAIAEFCLGFDFKGCESCSDIIDQYELHRADEIYRYQ